MSLTPKIVSCCTVFIVTFFFGVLPCGIVRLLNRRTHKATQQKYISWMNCLSGGVFFGTTFIHLVPESREELGKVVDIEYPVAEVLVSAGFFLVLLLEHLFGLCFNCCRTVSISDKNGLLNGTQIRENEYEISEIKRIPPKRSIQDNVTEETHIINGNVGQTNFSYSSNNDISTPDHVGDTAQANSVRGKSPVPGDSVSDIETVDDGRVSSVTGMSTSHVYEDIDGTINDSEEEKVSVFRATVLIVALSLHMVFEGLALGLQDKVPAIWTLLIVISVHKSIVAASVGLKLNDVMKRMTQICFCLFMFSLVTPLGIVIGILINSLTATENMVSGIMECVATGSFLYVTFFEILQREFVHEHHNLTKVVLAFVGFGVSAGAKLLQLYFHE